MRCPKCGRDTDPAPTTCSACGTTYDQNALETLGHVDFMIDWLSQQTDLLGQATYAQLNHQLRSQRHDLLHTLLPPAVPSPGMTPVTEAVIPAEPTPTLAEPAPIPVEPAPLAAQPVIALAAAEQMAVPAEAPPVVSRVARVVEPQPRPAETIPPPVPRVKPAPRPRPRLPTVDWGKAWQKLVAAAASGALLRGLLYLGAFMIVVSATILVVRFWDRLPTPAQVGFIFSVPAAFYLVGWVLRRKLNLPQAGMVLTAIGEILFAVDFAAIYQFGHLSASIDVFWYWFATSLLCTALYVVTAWRIPVAFMGYLAGIGLANVLIALSFALRLPAGWAAAAAVVAGLVLVSLSILLKRPTDRPLAEGKVDHWRGLAAASRHLAVLMLPASQIAALLLLLTLSPDDLGARLALPATFALAAIGYALLTWRSAFLAWPHATSWSAAAAVCLLAWVLYLPDTWWPVAIILLAAACFLAELGLRRGLAGFASVRPHVLFAPRVTGFSLMALGILAGMAIISTALWHAVLALGLAAALLGWTAILYKRPYLLVAAGALLVVPATLAASQLLQDQRAPYWLVWTFGAWVVLAAAYTGGARALRSRPAYASALYLLAQILAPLTLVALASTAAAAALSQVFPDFYDVPKVTPQGAGPNGATLAVLAGVWLLYLVMAWIHDRGRDPGLSAYVTKLPGAFGQNAFLWPLAGLLPVWLALGLAFAAPAVDISWTGVLLAAIALAYTCLGQLLMRYRPAYRLPLHVLAYPLLPVGVAFATSHAWPLLTTLLLAMATLAALAVARRRYVEAVAAALLFIWPFQLMLILAPIPPEIYPLAYSLLASLGYLPLGLVWHSRLRESRSDWPAAVVLACGYSMACAALAATLLAWYGRGAVGLAWVTVAVPLVLAAMTTVSLVRLHLRAFAWTTVALLAIAYGHAVTLIGVPFAFAATCWASLALVTLLGSRLLASRFPHHWLAAFRPPLEATTALAAVAALALTAPQTVAILGNGWAIASVVPLVAAQGLVLAIVVLAAWLCRKPWLLYLDPLLAFFTTTLLVYGFGPQLLGRPLTPSDFGLAWLALGVLYLVIAFLLDRKPLRYSHGLYAGGYLLVLLGMAWTARDVPANLIALGATILIALASQALAHAGRHHTFDDLLAFLWPNRKDSALATAVSMIFLFFASYAFPVWLMRLLTDLDVSMAQRALALAIVAPIYVLLGLGLRRLRTTYTWPLYSAGYALTAIAALLAVHDERMAIAVFTLDAVVYAASAWIFRQAIWLYLSNTLVPIIALMGLHVTGHFTAPWVAGVFMGLAYGYLGIGQGLGWGRRVSGEVGPVRLVGLVRLVNPYSLSFTIPAYALSALALAVAASEQILAIWVFTAAVALYALSARLFREPLFLYPAAWLAVVPYYLTMELTSLPAMWYGLGLLPLIAACLAIGKLAFHRRSFVTHRWQDVMKLLTGEPAMPFYLLAYALIIGMVVRSWGNAWPLTLALTAAAALYVVSTAIFRERLWLFPALLATHLAVGAALTIAPSTASWSQAAMAFEGLTWVLVALGLVVERRAGDRPPMSRKTSEVETAEVGEGMERWPALERLAKGSWAQPFFLFAAVDVVVWQAVAMLNLPTALAIAIANLVLLAFLAVLWRDRALPYGAIGFSLLAAGVYLASIAMPLATSLAWFAGIGLGLYLLGWGMQWVSRFADRLAPWPQPLALMGFGVATIAMAGTLLFVLKWPLVSATGLALAGALYLAMAYRRRLVELGYLAVGLMLVAWVLVMIEQNVSEPQLYAVPAGLYIAGIGMMERHRGRQRFACFVESSGLAILLTTSFIQSLSATHGFPYFVLLMGESVLVMVWAAIRRVRIPFFLGLVFAVLNVVAQLVLLAVVNDVVRWIVILGAGVLLVGAAIWIERQHERLSLQIHHWQETLAGWKP